MAPNPILLLTRPEAQSARFAQDAQLALGPHRCVISPLLQIVDVPGNIETSGFRGLIFTSENAVRSFARRSAARSIPAWCVGDRTAFAAAEIGLVSRSAGGDSGELATLIRDAGSDGPLLHLRGKEAAGDLAEGLVSAGIETVEQVIYDQTAAPLTAEAVEALQGNLPVFAPLFSPRTARLFRDAASGARAPLTLVPISAAAAAPLAGWPGVTVQTARRPNADAVMQALLQSIAAAPGA